MAPTKNKAKSEAVSKGGSQKATGAPAKAQDGDPGGHYGLMNVPTMVFKPEENQNLTCGELDAGIEAVLVGTFPLPNITAPTKRSHVITRREAEIKAVALWKTMNDLNASNAKIMSDFEGLGEDYIRVLHPKRRRKIALALRFEPEVAKRVAAFEDRETLEYEVEIPAQVSYEKDPFQLVSSIISKIQERHHFGLQPWDQRGLDACKLVMNQARGWIQDALNVNKRPNNSEEATRLLSKMDDMQTNITDSITQNVEKLFSTTTIGGGQKRGHDRVQQEDGLGEGDEQGQGQSEEAAVAKRPKIGDESN